LGVPFERHSISTAPKKNARAHHGVSSLQIAWKLGRQEFKGRLRELMWRQAQRSIAMSIFLAKQWPGYTDRSLIGDLRPPPVALDNSESDDAVTALIWAAKQANKRTNEGENGDKWPI
jgi:hypothetical protein